MINGAHAIIYSTAADKDRAFLKEVIGLPSVDVGGGWLIFGLPPSEIAVHPGPRNDAHELYFMCDDIEAFVRSMNERGIECAPIANQGWGMLTKVTLPGGGQLGVYQPRHARPPAMTLKAAAPKPAKSTAASKAKAKPAAKKSKPAPKAKPAPKTKTAAKPKAKKAKPVAKKSKR